MLEGLLPGAAAHMRVEVGEEVLCFFWGALAFLGSDRDSQAYRGGENVGVLVGSHVCYESPESGYLSS